MRVSQFCCVLGRIVPALLALLSCGQYEESRIHEPPVRMVPGDAGSSEVPRSEVALDQVLPSQQVSRAVAEAVAVPLPARPVGVATGSFDWRRRHCTTPGGFVPRMYLVDGEPRAGSFVELECRAGGDHDQVLAISLRDDALPDGTALPVRILGAPDCFVGIPHDITLPLTRSRHRIRINLPGDAREVYGRVFFQLVVSAPAANTAGVVTSRVRQLDIGEPRTNP